MSTTSSPLPPNLELEEYELLFTAMTKLVKAGADTLTRDELVAVSAVQIRTGFMIQDARRGGRAQRSVAD
jgi:hypothetical protein